MVVAAGAAIALRLGGGFHWLFSYLAGVNLATAALYAADKASSRHGWERAPERVLHLLALLGGTPAAYASQRLLSHKTLKGSFRRVFWIVAGLQAALVSWLLWEYGRGG